MSKFLLKGEGGEKAEIRRRIEVCSLPFILEDS